MVIIRLIPFAMQNRVFRDGGIGNRPQQNRLLIPREVARHSGMISPGIPI
jgi:hypothetical protein